MPFVEAQPHDGRSGLRGRLEQDAHEAVFLDGERRLAAAFDEHGIVVQRLDFPPRAVRRIDAIGAERAGPRGLARRVEDAQRDQRLRAAVGRELRLLGDELRAHAAAAVAHGALEHGDLLARGADDGRDEPVVAGV